MDSSRSVSFDTKLFFIILLSLSLLSGCGSGSGRYQGSTVSDDTLIVQGSVALMNKSGAYYSFRGAIASIYGVKQYYKQYTQGKGSREVAIGFSEIETDDGTISLRLPESEITNQQFYILEIACPDNQSNDLCQVGTPIHMVLTGEQLMASNWQANVLTEMAYQHAAYYVLAAYNDGEINTLLAQFGDWMLFNGTTNESASPGYQALLSWRVENSRVLRHQNLIDDISQALAGGTNNEWLQEKLETLLDPVLSTLDLGKEVISLEVSNDFLFVITKYNRLIVFDVSDSSSPKKITEVPAEKVYSFGNFFYVLIDNRLKAYSIADPASPVEVLLGDYETLGTFHSISQGIGFFAYEEQEQDKIQMIDFRFPNRPSELGVIDVETALFKINVKEHYLYLSYVTEGISTLKKINLNNLNQSTTFKLDHLLGDARLWSVLSNDGETAIVESFNPVKSTEMVHHISLEGSSPELLGSVELSKPYLTGYLYSTTSASENKISFIGPGHPGNTIIVLEVGDSGDLDWSQSGVISVPEAISHLFLQDGLIYAASYAHERLYIMDSNIFNRRLQTAVVSHPKNSHEFHDFPYYNIDFINNMALVSACKSGILAFDITDPAHPSYKESVFYSEEGAVNIAMKVIVQESSKPQLFLKTWNQGVYQQIGENLSDLQRIAGADNVSNDMAATTDYLYYPGHSGQLNILSSTDGFSEIQTIYPDVETNYYSRSPMMANDQYLLTGSNEEALVLFSLSDPINPRTLGVLPLVHDTYPFDPLLNGVIDQGYVYIANVEYGFFIVDIGSDPTNPKVVSQLTWPGQSVLSVAIQGDYAYLSLSESDVKGTLKIFDIKQPESPQVIGSIPLLGGQGVLNIHNDQVYIANSYGLEVFRAIAEEE